MKCINNCFVFNKEEIKLPIQAMVYMEMDYIKMLSAPSIVKKAETDEKTKATCIRMCREVQDITQILMDVQKQGQGPKNCPYSPPFNLEFSEYICSITPENLFKNFAAAASKKVEQKGTSKIA